MFVETVVTARTVWPTWMGTGPEPGVVGTKSEANGSWGMEGSGAERWQGQGLLQGQG